MSPPRKSSSEDTNRSIAARWTPHLADRWVPISSYFLENYHRLVPHENAKGLSSSEFTLLVHIIAHKWSEAAPFPSQETLANRMGVSARRVRQILKSLKDLGYLRWDQRAYNSNLYDLQPLYDALEELMKEDGLISTTSAEMRKQNDVDKEVTR